MSSQFSILCLYLFICYSYFDIYGVPVEILACGWHKKIRSGLIRKCASLMIHHLQTKEKYVVNTAFFLFFLEGHIDVMLG